MTDGTSDAAFEAIPLLVQKLGPKQIAFVVRDLEAATKQWWDLLRIGPWKAWEYTPEILKDMTYKGAPPGSASSTRWPGKTACNSNWWSRPPARPSSPTSSQAPAKA